MRVGGGGGCGINTNKRPMDHNAQINSTVQYNYINVDPKWKRGTSLKSKVVVQYKYAHHEDFKMHPH